ncbi:NAD-dependent epimerase/dehydratase family protein [Paenibacillus sp. sptzw28]|uniref:NAD-dependent epimerase/dehydratase family protein n=1 Tax=Paenibacillus sp. sptzw28 TaxID=715179 RepID=UPI001C6DF512|nr:NAD-dependent epimerase/dehydratase family protein [Paenibacillus sp. sptzw28]QYR23039.1 NAD-dependent epimerase/dehydratase family protein [Paenibacillus sp. sptzw28]
MKTVVTGGTGFIGSRLTAALISAGNEVLVLDDLSSGSAEDIPQGAKFMQMSVCDPELPSLLGAERPEVVYHMAAQDVSSLTFTDVPADLTTNVIGTLNVLEGCRQSPGCKIVLASTAAVFGDLNIFKPSEELPERPLSPYGLSKRIAERYTVWYYRLHRVPFTILRFANVYGPGQKPKAEGAVVAVFIERLRQGLPLLIEGDGTQMRDFVHVDDIVRACLLAACKGFNETLHIGTGEPCSIIKLAHTLAALQKDPVPAVRHVGKRPYDAFHSVFVPDKAGAVLDWSPQIRFAEGIRATYAAETGGGNGINYRDEVQAQP